MPHARARTLTHAESIYMPVHTRKLKHAESTAHACARVSTHASCTRVNACAHMQAFGMQCANRVRMANGACMRMHGARAWSATWKNGTPNAPNDNASTERIPCRLCAPLPAPARSQPRSAPPPPRTTLTKAPLFSRNRRHYRRRRQCCVLHVACCMLHVACCMLRIACCMLQRRNGNSHKARAARAIAKHEVRSVDIGLELLLHLGTP